jgi:hypothetical protein
MGRTGTTILAYRISKHLGIPNQAEILNQPDGRHQLITQDEWVAKYFVEIDNGDFVDHVELIRAVNPTRIIHSYRDNQFEQFLSFELARNTGKWNSSKKFQYQPIFLDDVDERIRYFCFSLALLDRVIKCFVNITDDVEYNQITDEDILGFNFQDDHQPVIKQTTFEQKKLLFENIDQIEERWKDIAQND